jgi:hypothetical protein
MNSNINSPKKMTPSQLEGWVAIRKKCAPQKSKSLILVKKSTNKNLKNLKIFSIIYIESRERDFKLIPFF